MQKFFDVFQTLRLPEDLAVYFTNTEVTRVSKTSTNSLARVYLISDKLINKQLIYKVEDALKKQIFRMKNMDVRIIDRYHLSKQYTPVTVMEAYYDSIQFELEKYWTLEYNLLKNSTLEFEDEHCLVITLEDSFLAHTYAESLQKYFKQVFLNRFGFDIDVIYRYKEKLGSHYGEENEHRLNLRIKQIENTMKAAMQTEADDSSSVITGSEKKKKQTGENKKSQVKMSAGDSKKGPDGFKNTSSKERFSRDNAYFKKPSNNDVLYGRDFDDEPIAIETIDSALGEVVISGMIRRIEEKEIRNEKTILMFDITDFTDTITVKMFARNEQLPELKEFIKKGNFIKVKGLAALDRYDQEIAISNVWGIRKSSDTREVRNDLALNKRVELHCHTKMSDMDGVSYAKDIIKQAIRW